MMAAIHFENLVFILFVIVAFFFQILAKAATKSSKRSSQPKPQTPSSPPTPPRAPANSEEDRIRKFMEALGQPTSSPPPAPVAPRPTYQKPIVVSRLPPLKSSLPPLTTRPPELPPDIKSSEQVPPTRAEKKFRARVTPPPIERLPIIDTPAETYEAATAPISKTKGSPTDFVTLLRSTSGLRQAMILREVFGPPRSFQPLAEPGFGGQLLQ